MSRLTMITTFAAIGLHGVIPDQEKKILYLSGVDRCRFRRPVVPGDQLRLTMEIVKIRSKTCKMKGIATVDGEMAAEAEIMSALVDRWAA